MPITDPDKNRNTMALPAKQQSVSLITLCLMALVVGSVTGLGAVTLRALIGLLHNLFFFGDFSFAYDANQLTPLSPWGPWIILVPVIGGLGVVYLVKNFAPEARGHGVPEVMDAIYYREGRIRPMVVLIKSLASALSIGCGAAVGREGPIIQIGSAIGSTIGQRWRLANWQTITLVAAGAGAGIAATFNTPLGAVMFAVELMLPEVSSRTFLPVVLATGAATYVGRIFFGLQPAFLVPVMNLPDILLPTSFSFLPIYVLLGIICGFAAWAFVALLYRIEDMFEAIPGGPYVQSVIGMGAIGLLLYGLSISVGNYYVDGVGYGTIQAILTNSMTSVWLMGLLFVAKILATSISLGAGASGGIFSPSLFIGATLGGSFGALLAVLWPELGFNPVQFAIIGMAAIVGGSTGAAMTAIFMIFEMTANYSVIVPGIIAVACAIGVRRTLSSENIYTLKLARRGHYVPKDRHTNMLLVRQASDVMQPITSVMDITADAPGAAEPGYMLVTRGRHIVGVRSPGQSDGTDHGALHRRYVIAREKDIMTNVLNRMGERGRKYALVVRGEGIPHASNVIGVIGPSEVAAQMMKQFRS